MRIHSFIMAGALAAFVPPAFAADETPVKLEKVDAEALPPVITLENALARGLRKSPAILASRSRGQAADATVEQAGTVPNPDLSIDLDNIMGDGPYKGLDEAEITVGVSQRVEMPGKRSGRIGVAEAQKTQSHFAEDTAQLDLIRDITIAYAEIVAAQEDVKILGDDARRAQDVLDSVTAKVDAGKEPPIQKSKANVEQANARIARDRAQRELESRRGALKAYMGEEDGDFAVDAASLPPVEIPELYDTYRTSLRETPDMKSMTAMVTQAQSALSLERANAVPDPTFSFGVKDLRGDDAQALVAGISFPIPVFDANRGNIKRAGHELNAAMLDERGAQLSLDALLKQVYGNFSSAYADRETLTQTIVPGAEEAFRIAREGYDAGKFGYLDVLDAQRTLFDARRQLNAAILDYHRQRAILERLTTTHDEQHASTEGKDHDKKTR